MFKPKGVMFLTLIVMLMALSCSGPDSNLPVLKVEFPLHLEEHISDARIEGSEVPEDLLVPMEWSFDEPQPDWKPAGPIFSEEGIVRLESIEEALRIHFSEANRGKNSGNIIGAVYVDLPDLRRGDWGDILIRARNSEPFFNVRLFYNLGERMHPDSKSRSAVLFGGNSSSISRHQSLPVSISTQ